MPMMLRWRLNIECVETEETTQKKELTDIVHQLK